MEAFVQSCAAGGLKGHPKVPVDEGVVREMVKIYCIVGQEEKALELLQSAEATYHLTLSAAAYEPLIFHYALLETLQEGGGRPLALRRRLRSRRGGRGPDRLAACGRRGS